MYAFLKGHTIPLYVLTNDGKRQIIVVQGFVFNTNERAMYVKSDAGLIPFNDLRNLLQKDDDLLYARWERDQIEIRQWDGCVRHTVK